MSTYFDVFDIRPIRLNLNTQDLEKKFHELSLASHPDRNQNSLDSVRKSSEINLAYKVLRDPWTRSLYVLGQFGLTQNSKVPPSLAETYFELQDLNDANDLLKLKDMLLNLRHERSKSLSALFAEFDRMNVASFDAVTSDLKHILMRLQELVLENTYSSSMLRDIEQRLGTRAA